MESQETRCVVAGRWGEWEAGTKGTRSPSEKATSSPDLVQNSPVSPFWENGIFPLMLWTETVKTREVNVDWRVTVFSYRWEHTGSL